MIAEPRRKAIGSDREREGTMVKRLSWTRGLLLALMAALAGATVAFGHPLYAQATARGP